MSALLRVSRHMLTSSFLQGAVAPAALRVHSTAQQRCGCWRCAAPVHPTLTPHATPTTRHASTAVKTKAEVVSKSDLIDLITQKMGACLQAARPGRGRAADTSGDSCCRVALQPPAPARSPRAPSRRWSTPPWRWSPPRWPRATRCSSPGASPVCRVQPRVVCESRGHRSSAGWRRTAPFGVAGTCGHCAWVAESRGDGAAVSRTPGMDAHVA